MKCREQNVYRIAFRRTREMFYFGAALFNGGSDELTREKIRVAPGFFTQMNCEVKNTGCPRLFHFTVHLSGCLNLTKERSSLQSASQTGSNNTGANILNMLKKSVLSKTSMQVKKANIIIASFYVKDWNITQSNLSGLLRINSRILRSIEYEANLTMYEPIVYYAVIIRKSFLKSTEPHWIIIRYVWTSIRPTVPYFGCIPITSFCTGRKTDLKNIFVWKTNN